MCEMPLEEKKQIQERFPHQMVLSLKVHSYQTIVKACTSLVLELTRPNHVSPELNFSSGLKTTEYLTFDYQAP